jgi:hypothetical protein
MRAWPPFFFIQTNGFWSFANGETNARARAPRPDHRQEIAQ